jgi:hypothetical protein
MTTQRDRAQNQVNRHASDAPTDAHALNAEFTQLQAQAQALLREARTGRLHFQRSRRR